MTTSSLSACPACAAAPLALAQAGRAHHTPTVVLSLPDIHCAGCIATVERSLLSLQGVRASRVNLSRKRVTIDAPGIDPDTLIDRLADAGITACAFDTDMLDQSGSDPAGHALLTQLSVAGFAMMNVMLFSVAVWSGASDATRVMFHWVSAMIAVPVLLFSAQVFFQSAWGALRVRHLNMDVPISLAIILAAGLSVYETVIGGRDVYFDAALSLTFFLLAGRYLDHRTRHAARSAAQDLAALESPRATRLMPGGRETVAVSALRVGDTVAVAAGMRCPVDGRITTGVSSLDRSLITGESHAIPVKPGDRMTAGEVNLTGPLTITVTAVGEDTTLRRMAALVETAESARNRYTALADRAAQIYAPAVHLLALVTFLGWMVLTRDMSLALNIAISVLIITCPCALGLAVPAVMTAATGRLFRMGLLVKNGTAIERLAAIDTVVFDKTGTLTLGQARIDLAGLTPETVSILRALTENSCHPVARAIAAALPVAAHAALLENITEHPGKGISALWNGVPVRLGSADWIGTDLSPALQIGQTPPIPIALTETLRDGAATLVAQLQTRGLAVQLLSGDRSAPVADVARALGITDWQAQTAPAEKLARIKALQGRGHKVLMVGDGLNDTAALAQADASISPGTALDAARSASDVVLLGASLAPVLQAIETARQARTCVIQNFSIAAGYNAIAVPVAVFGLASPIGAAIAMSASSITVLLNALRLR